MGKPAFMKRSAKSTVCLFILIIRPSKPETPYLPPSVAAQRKQTQQKQALLLKAREEANRLVRTN